MHRISILKSLQRTLGSQTFARSAEYSVVTGQPSVHVEDFKVDFCCLVLSAAADISAGYSNLKPEDGK